MAKITVAYFRKVYKDFVDEKTTMSRMVERLNEKANDNSICEKCFKEYDDNALRQTGLCTACFTRSA
jgi:transcriptional regulator of met regulon